MQEQANVSTTLIERPLTANFRNGFFAGTVMKWIIAICMLCMACNQSSQQRRTQVKNDSPGSLSVGKNPMDTIPVRSPDHMIMPGKSIGWVGLGTEASALEHLLGRPDLSDAAMGKAWLTWKGKRDLHNHLPELNIYITYRDNSMREKIVRQIRTTSPDFSTEKGLSVYSSYDKLRKDFPGIKKVASYQEDGREILLFDDRDQGIAFEIAIAGKERICTGIIVHEKGKGVNDIYITLHPEMKIYTEAPASE